MQFHHNDTDAQLMSIHTEYFSLTHALVGLMIDYNRIDTLVFECPDPYLMKFLN